MKPLVSLFILKLYARINIFKLLLIFPFRKTKWKQRRRKNKTITILKNYMRRVIKIYIRSYENLLFSIFYQTRRFFCNTSQKVVCSKL